MKNDEQNRKLLEEMEEIDQCKDDSARMFKAIRSLQNATPKEPLLLDTKTGGKTAVDEDHAEIITEFFKSLFQCETAEKMEDVPPKEMEEKFKTKEVSKAISKLKNNKAAGIDELHAEQLKYGPEMIHAEIADILNEVARTGDHPREINLGVLAALQKPGKPVGPCKSLRPIILLSMLRKILAIIMINRTGDRIQNQIPITQAAYSKGRSTTEHVIAIKLLAEKAISSDDYHIHILMMDMSRAFDTVNRKLLMEDLKEVLNDDELHIIKLLLHDVKLVVRCGTSHGEEFTTHMGVPQGDCLSPILFTLYLANALREESTPETPISHDHQYAKTSPEQVNHEDHPYSQLHHTNKTKKEDDTTPESINMQYADDINFVTLQYPLIPKYQEEIPQKLKKRDLECNASKNEYFKVTRKYNPAECINCQQCGKCGKCKSCKECPYCKDWRKCKFLGSMIDTKSDIKRRKSLSINAMNKLDVFWKNERTSNKTKIKVFNIYIASIFLFNAPLWSMDKTTEKSVDAFQRRLLRRVLNFKYPRVISTARLNIMTKEPPWTKQIAYRRLSWFGHMMRLDDNTPAKLALKEAERPIKMSRGGQRTTWLGQMKKHLESIGLTYEKAKCVAMERDQWWAITNEHRPVWAEVPE